MDEPKTTSASQTRRHGSEKRPHRLEITFSDTEWKTVNALAKKADQDKLPAFVRKLILGGGILEAAVSAQDRRDICHLSRIATNLWQLRKDLLNYGVDEQLSKDLETFRGEFANILMYYRSKIEK